MQIKLKQIVLDLLEANELLDPRNVIAATKDIMHTIEESKLVILFDFLKTFNSISCRRLLQKIHTFYSLNTIKSFYSYIFEHYQVVMNVDGTVISWAKSSSCVPFS